MSLVAGRRVAVIGAGPAGLACAVALAQRGAAVHVYEQAPALEPVGAGLQLSPNGVAVLDALGVQVPHIASQAVELRDHARGARVTRLDLASSRWPQGFHLVHRADLITALERAARGLGVQITLGAQMSAEDSQADLIVGADGVKSATRARLNGDRPAFFTNQVAWRAVVADDAPAEAHVYMGPGRHLVTYPLIGGRRNIVAVQEREDWVEEDWDLADDPASLRAAFKGFAPEVRDLLSKVEQVKLWGLFRHPVAETWHDARHVLIGDAAHPTLPFLAQGANLALEDAFVLADCLSKMPMKAALIAYQGHRKPRVTRAINTANANARNYHLSNPVLRIAAHTGLRFVDRVSPDFMLKRFEWLYGADVTRGAGAE